MSLIEKAVARIQRPVDKPIEEQAKMDRQAASAGPSARVKRSGSNRLKEMHGANGAADVSTAPTVVRPSVPSVPSASSAPSVPNVSPVSSASNVSQGSRLPTRRSVPLGGGVEFPTDRLRERGFISPETMATATGFEFRVLAQTVREAAIRPKRADVPHPRRVMMTSAVPGEGKTFCAVNLAIGLALASDHPVIFVDADVVRRSASSLLGLSKSPGTMEFLKGAETIASKLVRPTQYPNLKLLPAGTTEEHAGRLLATKRMEAMLDQIEAAFPDALVIIDAPPLLAVTECRVLAQQIGQVLVIVAAGETPRAAVDEALASLEDIEGVSLILNKTPASQSKNREYYEY